MTKNMHVIALLRYCVIASLLTLWGCARITEYAKGIAGVSTKVLEGNRKSAIIKVFNYDYFTSYTKTWDTLKDIGAYIYLQDIKKHLIAIYVSETDTTPVGLFFKEIDKNHTQIEVSSPSTSAKEFISERIFEALSPAQK